MKKSQKKEILIEVKNVGLTYETNTKPIKAIENISFQMGKGEFLCLLGPSGCGKSTLLKIIAGYLKPTIGSCLMQGQPIQGPDWNRGVVFQSPTLYPWMSVRKNVEFGPKMKGFSKDKIEKLSQYFLEQVELSGYADKATFELSGGMKQRVALARALANQPKIILMDEPFGALDAFTRVNMQALIRKIWKENHSTMFMITHDIDEALSLGTRVMVMSKSPGKIEKEFHLDFTYTAMKNKYGSVEMGEEYRKVKEEILEFIKGY
ncbi:ABC transporter ATP-binding protein [Garciella nitratireducens]|uniref:Taurine transport system ATP-binding protein n=1 Tax=Garciella nitratireducens DSM 15102 TaxID=1121911 RepID=A0A1T4L1Q5_9FIRM|nr:ABC transporter ATP-binding protein [Garciella nitratireducens]SJZ48626.1 taurine transport system ATP-binding protein [Garciella nitratireducens DSM 15102]